MRRRSGTLLRIESDVLGCALGLRGEGAAEFHGFQIAKEIADRDGARRLTSHGTLYKALDRMERAGLLESRWEDPEVAAADGRPRRRLYRVTPMGEAALAPSAAEPTQPRPDVAPSLGWISS